MFLKLDYSQKIYAGLAILLLLIIPYFIARIQNKDNTDNLVPQETALSTPLALEQDKNVSRIENLQTVFSKSQLFKIINLNGKMFFIDENGLTNAENNQNYPFPDDFTPLKAVSNMDDLNLIFLINKDNKIISWSPVSKKFQDQSIEITSDSNILPIAGTHLTYLYLIDKNNNQIYRYPRGGTGFAEKINWLKENINLSNVSNMAINDSIFLIQDNVLKFFENKKQSFEIESTATPIKSEKIYASKNSRGLYILDKENSRVIKLDLDGKIVSQFYNAEISEAQDFEINEESNLAYFSNGNEVKSFEMK